MTIKYKIMLSRSDTLHRYTIEVSPGEKSRKKTASPSKRPASPPSSTMLILPNDHGNFDGV